MRGGDDRLSRSSAVVRLRHGDRRAAAALRALLSRRDAGRRRPQGGRRKGRTGSAGALEDRARLRQAARLEPGRSARHHAGRAFPPHAHVRLRPQRFRRHADHRPPAQRHRTQPVAHRSAVRHRRHAGDRAGAHDRVSARQLSRPQRGGDERADHERVHPALHHRRTVRPRQSAALVPDLRIRSVAERDRALSRPAGADRRHRPSRPGRALLPHAVSRGARTRLRAHRLRQGLQPGGLPCAGTSCATP